jgi:hypothetical protein
MESEEREVVKNYRGYDILYYPHVANKSVWTWYHSTMSVPSFYEKEGYIIEVLFDESGERAERWIERSDNNSVLLERIQNAVRELELEIDDYLDGSESATDEELFESVAEEDDGEDTGEEILVEV